MFCSHFPSLFPIFSFFYMFLIFFIFSIFFILFHFSSFSWLFYIVLHFSAFFSTFLHFSQLFNIVEKKQEKWRKVATKPRFLSMCHLCVCIRHLRWHVDRHLCFVITFLHLSPLFSTLLRFSHFLHFSSLGNTTGRGSTAGNEKCHVYEFMKLKLQNVIV